MLNQDLANIKDFRYVLDTGFYSNRVLMSFDRNRYIYRFIIGARGIGKTYSTQNLTCNLYHKVKHLPEDSNNIDDMFLYVRLTKRSIENMKDDFLDSKLQDDHNILSKRVGQKIYYNDRHMGDIVALADAPVIKGGAWNWRRYRFVIIDEFQRERKERRTFDIIYNLRSVLESTCRITTRLKLGLDMPTVILTGNTVDEATDLLHAFDYLPTNFGTYKLKKKQAIIQFVPNSKEYDELLKVNPLNVLQQGDDFTFGEEQLRTRYRIVDYKNTGHRNFIAFLHITDYIRFEVWRAQQGYIYISKGLQTAKHHTTHNVLHRHMANKGTVFNTNFYLMIRDNYEQDNIVFDSRMTGMLFNQNM